MGVANANRATSFFISDKQGGSVSQRQIERFGQGRPSPTATCLAVGSMTLVPDVVATISFTEITLDGLGIAGFGTLVPYSPGPTILLGSGISNIVVNFQPNTAAPGDQYSLQVLPRDTASSNALGVFLGIGIHTTVSFPQAPIFPVSLLLPPIVVGGWQASANGASQTAQFYLQLLYQGPQTSVVLNSITATISRVS